MTADMRNVIKQKLVGTDMSISAIAAEHGISPSTIYNVFPGGRSALDGEALQGGVLISRQGMIGIRRSRTTRQGLSSGVS